MKCEKIFHLDTSSLRVGGQTTVNLFVKHAKKVRVAENFKVGQVTATPTIFVGVTGA